MLRLYIGIAIALILIIVAIRWMHVTIKKANKSAQDYLQSKALYYRCMHCGLPFIPQIGSTFLPTCPNCGQSTNISGRQPFSQNDIDEPKRLLSLDKSNPETWAAYAVRLMQQSHYAEAKKCLEMLEAFSNLDETLQSVVAHVKSVLKEKGY